MLIYVVEDDKNINEIESYALKSNNFEVMSLYSAAELKQAIDDKVPDLILLDIMLPDNDGVKLTGMLRRSSRVRKTPIMLVSAKSSEMEKVRGLDAGADDYLTKPFGMMEFTSRVKALVRRAEINGEHDTGKLKTDDIVMDDEKREVFYRDKNIILTYKEFELLKYLMINRGIVLSRDKIMENVWGFDFQGESRTVDMHIKTLRAKLGKGNNVIKTVRNVGYKLN